MTDGLAPELVAEIEAFHADLQARAERHAEAAKRANVLDLPSIDHAELDVSEAKALISQRYGQIRYDKRLAELETRIARIEARDGRPG